MASPIKQMNKEQIIDLWKSVGWYDLNDYHTYLKSSDERLVLDSLDPDKVDPKEFWRASDEHFSTDPVCNHSNLSDTKLSIKEANRFNYRIPLDMGMISQTGWLVSELYRVMGYVAVAEIGCGYGSFFDNFIATKDKIDYRGFDVIPRTSSALEIEGYDGCFSEAQVLKYTEKFNLFFSSNTFQHLSQIQITKYLNQVYSMLPYGGYFNLMYVKNSTHSYHYGQRINLIEVSELEAIIESIGYSIIGNASIQIPNSLTPYSVILKK